MLAMALAKKCYKPRVEALVRRVDATGSDPPAPATVFIAFPGTKTGDDVVTDLQLGMQALASLKARSPAGALSTLPGSVHSGFLHRLVHVLTTSSVAEDVEDAVKSLVTVSSSPGTLSAALWPPWRACGRFKGLPKLAVKFCFG